MHVLMHTIVTQIQWNFSTVDTPIGIQLAVPYREVSTQLYVAGTANSVLIREMPNSEVDLCTALSGWDYRHCPH